MQPCAHHMHTPAAEHKRTSLLLRPGSLARTTMKVDAQASAHVPAGPKCVQHMAHLWEFVLVMVNMLTSRTKAPASMQHWFDGVGPRATACWKSVSLSFARLVVRAANGATNGMQGPAARVIPASTQPPAKAHVL